MAKIPAQIIKKIKRYLNEIENENIHIEQAYLYGSYSTGKHTEFSDIDIALVSKDFQGSRYNDNLRLLDAGLKVDSSISPITYRPEDFTPDNLFVKEILKHGIRIV
ncbi:MAG: nucleotidyltransferase domain-containing protein [FCB group bacterium]|jgi:predicted nucleotidyltransferase